MKSALFLPKVLKPGLGRPRVEALGKAHEFLPELGPVILD
jgi:hypothetical protein